MLFCNPLMVGLNSYWHCYVRDNLRYSYVLYKLYATISVGKSSNLVSICEREKKKLF